MSEPITIRRAETPEDHRALQAAQRAAWGITEDGYVVPVATMVGAQLHGGLVLGAYLPDGSAVGLSFAFLGRVEGRIGLYSQLTGVIPGWQDRGIGGALKRRQREIAREEGVELIAWAFDPLQAGNARFNLDKLGATSGKYVENMYGARTDGLNAGVPTDRLIVVWETAEPASAPPPPPVPSAGLPRLIDVRRRPDGVREPVSAAEPTGNVVLLEVPIDVKRLRADDPALAESWRHAVKTAFQAAFAQGFRAVGFERTEEAGATVGRYRLIR